jgi:hypothetical protein
MGLHTRAELRNHIVYDGSFDAVDDVVAGSRDIVAITADFYIALKPASA